MKYVLEWKAMVQKTVPELVEELLKRGGRVNRYYLQKNLGSKQALVYLNGWYSGQNIREAITKAFAAQ